MSGVASELADGSFEFLVEGIPGPGMVATREVRDHDGALPASLRDDLLLLLTELVTNAVRHSGAGPQQSLSVSLSWGDWGVTRTQSGTSSWCEIGAEV